MITEPSETPISDLISETLRLAFENQELIHKDRVKTREINIMTAENRKLLDALRKAKAALQEHARLFGIDPNSPCDKCQAYAAITEALK